MAKKNIATEKITSEPKQEVAEVKTEENNIAKDEIIAMDDNASDVKEKANRKENVLDKKMGEAIADDMNKKFIDAKKHSVSQRMFGYLWNGQEMDW